MTTKAQIKPHYDNVGKFYGGLAIVEFKGKYGLVDENGNEVIPPKYDEFKPFSEGLLVGRNGKWGFIDKSFNAVIAPKYKEIVILKNGFAKIRFGIKWGVIDKSGNEVVSPKYAEIKDFKNNFAQVMFEKKWGFIDESGNEIISTEDGGDIPFSEDIYPFNLAGKWGLRRPFCEGYAAIRFNRKWGFMDSNENIVIPCQYRFVRNFSSDGLTWVKLFESWMQIDRTGNVVKDI
jgi:hypothetical protein